MNFQILYNRKFFKNLVSRSRAYNQIAPAKLSGDALLGDLANLRIPVR